MLVLDWPVGKQEWVDEISARDSSSVASSWKSAGVSVKEAGPWEAVIRKLDGFM